jgi:hypothetical protein
MTVLETVSKACTTILPFMAAFYQMLMAYDNRARQWKFLGCLASVALFLFFGWLRLTS